MRGLAVLLVVSLWLSVQTAHAQPRNPYGAKGRTVLATGFTGEVHGSGYTQSRAAWNVSTRVTLVHFVRDNLAIGGTLMMGVSRQRDTGYIENIENSSSGGDIDIVGHLPLSSRLSLRFWGWLGV